MLLLQDARFRMAYDEKLAFRIEDILRDKGIGFVEKKMMGGLAFLVEGKMCIGVVNNRLMARIDPEIYEKCLAQKGCNEMDFTGRPMKGFVFIDPDVIESDDSLIYWIQLCLDYNPIARSTKRKKNSPN